MPDILNLRVSQNKDLARLRVSQNEDLAHLRDSQTSIFLDLRALSFYSQTAKFWYIATCPVTMLKHELVFLIT